LPTQLNQQFAISWPL